MFEYPFWEAFFRGFSYIMQPYVVLTAFVMSGVQVLFYHLLGILARSPHSKEGLATGCLTQIFVLLFQGILSAVIVLLLMPIIMGQHQSFHWAEVEPLGFIAVRAGLLVIFLLSLVSFVPVLGNFLRASPGLELFLSLSLIFRLVSPKYLEALGVEGSRLASLFPSVGQFLFMLLLVVIISKLLQISFHLLKFRGAFLENFATVFDSLVGFVFFLCYSQYVVLLK